MQPLKFGTKLLVAAIVLFGAMAVACCLGSVDISLREVFLLILGKKDQLSDSTVLILTGIRLPRVLMAAIVGGSLAVIGAVMQGLFLNPMADPSVLGISSGSAVGATLAIVTGFSGVVIGGAFTGTYIGAILGAVLTLVLVYSIARKVGSYDNPSILLTGIAISSIMSAAITVLMTLHLDNLEKIYMWTLGTFSSSTGAKLLVMAVAFVICFGVIIFIAPQLDVLKLGKDTASTLGINYSRTLGIVLVTTSVLLAFCVASSGIIGFIGLIIPHIVVFFKVYRMREKVIMCFLIGAIFTVVCDLIARTVVAPGEMAIGAITSIIGAPYFLFLLIRNSISYRRENR